MEPHATVTEAELRGGDDLSQTAQSRSALIASFVPCIAYDPRSDATIHVRVNSHVNGVVSHESVTLNGYDGVDKGVNDDDSTVDENGAEILVSVITRPIHGR